MKSFVKYSWLLTKINKMLDTSLFKYGFSFILKNGIRKVY